MSGRLRQEDRLRSGLVAGGAVLLLTFLASLLVAAPARAHTGLVDAVPAQGATGPAPEQLVLIFSEAVDPTLAAVSVTGPAGPVDLPASPDVRGRRLVQDLGALTAGDHRVRYRVVAGDGHPVTGQTTFTVRPPAAPTPVPGPAGAAAPPGSADGAPAASSEGGPASTPAASSEAGSGGTAAGVAVLLLLAAAALVVRRRPSVADPSGRG